MHFNANLNTNNQEINHANANINPSNNSNNKPNNIVAICPNCHRKETRKQWLENGRKKEKSKRRENNSLYGEIPEIKIPKIKF